MSTPDHYQVLGVERTATAEEIKAAFRRLAYLHPDQHPGDPTATARFAPISAAYAELSDPDARAKYDARPATPAPVTETVELIGEIVKGAKTVDPAKAGLRVLDKAATPQGREEIRTFARSLWGLLR